MMMAFVDRDSGQGDYPEHRYDRQMGTEEDQREAEPMSTKGMAINMMKGCRYRSNWMAITE